jgi:exodeoxyribonuclease VII large subunit
MIPLISAVGHETDVTLIDFASDRRAPTPTAAAEMAVPVRSELLERIVALSARRLACWARGLEQRRKELSMLSRALPRDILAGPRQQLDTLAERLPRALTANAQIHHRQYSAVAGRLAPQLLINMIERRKEGYLSLNLRLKAGLVANARGHQARILRYQERVVAFGERSERATLALLKQHKSRVERATQLLTAFSYREVLKRGFALVRDGDGLPLRSVAAVSSGMRLDIEFADGRVAAVADGEASVAAPKPKASAPKPPAKPRTRSEGSGGKDSGGQGGLFD